MPNSSRTRRSTDGSARRDYGIVVVGTSLGGFSALKILLAGFPSSFPAPIVVVQHQAEAPTNNLPFLLQRYSALPLVEPDDKQAVEPGRVFVAPGSYHLLLDHGHFALSIEELVLHARPSIDVLFESAADAYGRATVGVILTAASTDGARGLAKIKRMGGFAIVQDPASCESRVLPDATLALTSVDRVLPIEDIPAEILRLFPNGPTP